MVDIVTDLLWDVVYKNNFLKNILLTENNFVEKYFSKKLSQHNKWSKTQFLWLGIDCKLAYVPI